MQVLKRYVWKQLYNPGFPGLWLNPFYHAQMELLRTVKWLAPQRSGRTLDVAEQYRLNADVRVVFQLINAYLYKVLWTRYPVLNVLFWVIIMAPFNILGVLLYRLLPVNPDLYLD